MVYIPIGINVKQTIELSKKKQEEAKKEDVGVSGDDVPDPGYVRPEEPEDTGDTPEIGTPKGYEDPESYEKRIKHYIDHGDNTFEVTGAGDVTLITDKKDEDISATYTDAKTKYGYTPNDSDYATEQQKLSGYISDVSVNQGLITSNIRTMEKNREQTKTDIETIKSMPDETRVWIDFNANKIQDSGELMGKTQALTYSDMLLAEDVTAIKALPDKPQVWIDINQDAIEDADEHFFKEEAIGIKQKELSDLTQSIISSKMDYELLGKQASDILKVKGSLTVHEDAGYKLDVTPEGYQFSTPTATEVNKFVYGDQAATRVTGVSMMNLGLPTLAAGIASWATGDKKYGENELERLSQTSLNLTKGKNESFESYTGRFWTSPEAIESTWLPVATVGIGYAATAFTTASKAATTTYTAGRAVTTGSKVLSGTSKTLLGLGIVTTGVNLGYTAATQPELLPSTIGKTGFQWGIGYAGYKAGQTLYNIRNPVTNLTYPVSGKLRQDIVSDYAQTYVKDVDNMNYMRYDPATGNRLITQEMTPGRYSFENIQRVSVGGKYYDVTMTGMGQKIGDTINVSRAVGIIRPVEQTGFSFWGKSEVGHVFEVKGGSITFLEGGNVQFSFDRAFTSFRNPNLPITGMKETGFTMSYSDVAKAVQDVKVTKTIMYDMMWTTEVKPASFNVSAYEHIGTYETNISKGFYSEKGSVFNFQKYVDAGMKPTVVGDPSKSTNLKGLNQFKDMYKPNIPTTTIPSGTTPVSISLGQGTTSAAKTVGGMQSVIAPVASTVYAYETIPVTIAKNMPVSFGGYSSVSIFKPFVRTMPVEQQKLTPLSTNLDITKTSSMLISDRVASFDVVSKVSTTSVLPVSSTKTTVLPSSIRMVTEGTLELRTQAFETTQLKTTGYQQLNILKTNLKTMTTTPTPVPPTYITKPTFFGWPGWPTRLYGHGGKQYNWDRFYKFKRFRGRKTFNPLRSGFNLKPLRLKSFKIKF